MNFICLATNIIVFYYKVVFLPVLQVHLGHPSGAGIGSIIKPFLQLMIH